MDVNAVIHCYAALFWPVFVSPATKQLGELNNTKDTGFDVNICQKMAPKARKLPPFKSPSLEFLFVLDAKGSSVGQSSPSCTNKVQDWPGIKLQRHFMSPPSPPPPSREQKPWRGSHKRHDLNIYEAARSMQEHHPQDKNHGSFFNSLEDQTTTQDRKGADLLLKTDFTFRMKDMHIITWRVINRLSIHLP